MSKIKNILYFSLVFLFISSCTNEELKLNTPDIGDANTIEFSLSIKSNSIEAPLLLRSSKTRVAVRSVGTEPGDHDAENYLTDLNILNENKMERINVFIFSNTGSLITGYTDNEVIKANPETTTTDGSYKSILRIKKADISKIENQPVKVVVVANPQADITGINTLEELQKKVETYDDLNTTETPRKNFLMDGLLHISDINWSTNKSYSILKKIELKRALAKVRLRIADIKVKDFQNGKETSYEVVDDQISVKLVHYTQGSSLIDAKPYTTPADQWKESAYRTMKLKTYPGKTNEKNASGKFYGSFPFYAGECKWQERDTKNETYLIVKIKLRPEGHRAGDMGKDYYYRLPINYRKTMDGVEEARLHRVERNYLYDVVTTIEQLGSLDEGSPVNVVSNIAIQPWPEKPDEIDGTITDAQYLVVKEERPVMPNIDTYTVDYISSLPVEVRITKIYYEFYDKFGDYYKVVFSSTDNSYKFYKDKEEKIEVTPQEITAANLVLPDTPTGANDDASVSWTENKFLQDGNLTITHKIPNNFVPFQIDLLVTQKNTAKPLSETIHVTQYPPIFVTGERSPGFSGGTSKIIKGDIEPYTNYADFRSYSTIGMPSRYQENGPLVAQKNDIFNRITIKVPNGDISIGNPFNEETQMTFKEDWAQKIVSPEFIIATQHGMTNGETPQYSESFTDMTQRNNHDKNLREYYSPYGPSSTYFKDTPPYRTPNAQYNGGHHTYVKVYKSGNDKCYNYFEGEYGTNGQYGEWYWDRTTQMMQWRVVEKTFKYQGRWRMPTIAEAKLIDTIQDNDKSVTKNLMYGISYWTAKPGIAYGFKENRELNIVESPVRCIFDTYMHDDKK
ncbi:hypothetical protein IX307_001772 [Bacteroides pyogenes]|uniref:fimbrial tip adhesin FimD n=1 Tax=Bacteroides pyogenes TaxID=310300 RepID=UPI0011E47F15|nr:fimbrial protein [Bacteroides pyogenes]MBR8720603.1 hypothetical protein [Bacteroides pyogenes]MBR8787445.1 hypothetical protein [Bacteroides pyogenes]MBR8792955.1 hypothetical protein [Bacteroides pyogenes]TYK39228.1 hypothetical protein FNJ59_07850 [Bacteroides pyogenes]